LSNSIKGKLPLRRGNELHWDTAYTHVPHCYGLRATSERKWDQCESSTNDSFGCGMAHLKEITIKSISTIYDHIIK